MKTTVHVIPHAHWDREWYLPLEIHRARLVTQLDNVLKLLETDPSYTYHLDGQMIAVEDYLIYRPEREEEIKGFVREGRLHLGPWYVLQDEYLTSGESNIRNLLLGTAMAAKFGKACRIGYLPDAFGNVGQMPQIFLQAGMKAAVFGRGVSLRPENPDPENHFPAYSEFEWQSPDGSRIPAIFFAGWYNNGQEIPVDPETAVVYWGTKLAHAKRFASTNQLLFMNGSDHQPVQKDLAAALETARSLYPDIDFICSDFEKYAECVKNTRRTVSETVCGELAGQESDGTNTLCNTASTHTPIKMLNRRCESLLSLTAEPMLSMAATAGMKIGNALLHRAWKLLMQNHPHDSICSCSIDQVNKEVVSRFEKSIQLGEYLTKEAGDWLTKQIHAPGLDSAAAAFAVFNPSGWERSQLVTVSLGVDRVYGTREARPVVLSGEKKDYSLYNAAGEEIPADFEDQETSFGYDLPDDSFRKPYFERRIRFTFSAENIPPFGYTVFYLKRENKKRCNDRVKSRTFGMENRFLCVDIHADGTFDLTEKTTGRVYSGLGVYEDTGDVGNEYIFRETTGGRVTSLNADTEITCVNDSDDRVTFRIKQLLNLPVCADDSLAEAQESMKRCLERNIGRSTETTGFPITTFLTLEKNCPMLKIRTEFNNNVKDHRLRMLFPTGIATDAHLADSVFDVVERTDVPGKNWKNPSRCQRTQYFTAAEDGKGGLAVINRGLYEYEILPERKQIAVTLLRCIGEMGDWGVFPTPNAQCLEPVSADLAVFPYPGSSFLESGCREAVQFQTDMPVFQIRNEGGWLPECKSFLECRGNGLAFTALKPSEDEQALILRVCNVTERSSILDVSVPEDCNIYFSNITENKGDLITESGTGHIQVPVGKKEIKTLRIEKNRYE